MWNIISSVLVVPVSDLLNICHKCIADRSSAYCCFLVNISLSPSLWSIHKSYRCLFAQKEVNLVLYICLNYRVFSYFHVYCFISGIFVLYSYTKIISFNCLLTLPTVLFALLLMIYLFNQANLHCYFKFLSL